MYIWFRLVGWLVGLLIGFGLPIHGCGCNCMSQPINCIHSRGRGTGRGRGNAWKKESDSASPVSFYPPSQHSTRLQSMAVDAVDSRLRNTACTLGKEHSMYTWFMFLTGESIVTFFLSYILCTCEALSQDRKWQCLLYKDNDACNWGKALKALSLSFYW